MIRKHFHLPVSGILSLLTGFLFVFFLFFAAAAAAAAAGVLAAAAAVSPLLLLALLLLLFAPLLLLLLLLALPLLPLAVPKVGQTKVIEIEWLCIMLNKGTMAPYISIKGCVSVRKKGRRVGWIS